MEPIRRLDSSQTFPVPTDTSVTLAAFGRLEKRVLTLKNVWVILIDVYGGDEAMKLSSR